MTNEQRRAIEGQIQTAMKEKNFELAFSLAQKVDKEKETNKGEIYECRKHQRETISNDR